MWRENPLLDTTQLQNNCLFPMVKGWEEGMHALRQLLQVAAIC
jgi:hypothetical protein